MDSFTRYTLITLSIVMTIVLFYIFAIEIYFDRLPRDALVGLIIQAVLGVMFGTAVMTKPDKRAWNTRGGRRLQSDPDLKEGYARDESGRIVKLDDHNW